MVWPVRQSPPLLYLSFSLSVLHTHAYTHTHTFFLLHVDSFDETAQSPTAKEWKQEEEEGGINFRYLYGLHSGVTEKLTSICELWDDKLSNLEAEVVNGNSAITEDGTCIQYWDIYRIVCIISPRAISLTSALRRGWAYNTY